MEYTKEEQKANRKIWIDALRSGNFEQAKGKLKRYEGGYCCLGIACEISGLGYWAGSAYKISSKDEQSVFGLPKTVQNWLGLKNEGGTFEDDNSLIHCNDKANFTFKQIADVIESEPEGLVYA